TYGAKPGKHIHRTPAHATGGAGDQNRSVPGLEAVVLQSLDRQTRGDPGRAQRHGLLERETGGQWLDPVAREPGVLCVPAELRNTQVAADCQYLLASGEARVARLDDGACEINARNHPIRVDDGALREAGQAVLEVDARVLHAHGHVALGQVGERELLYAGSEPAAVLVQDERIEKFGHDTLLDRAPSDNGCGGRSECGLGQALSSLVT